MIRSKFLTNSGNADMVKLFVENGADANKPNDRGLTALDIAIEYGTDGI